MKGIEHVAEMMALAATTAPKSKGEDFVRTRVLVGDEVTRLAAAMADYGERTGKKNFDRDARGVAQAGAVLLVGLARATPLGLNCAACGQADCKTLLAQPTVTGEVPGPTGAFRQVDLGIALGSAVKTASLFNVDNRIMYRIGPLARELGLVDWEFVLGVPLSATGKNVFFDR